MKNKVSYLNVQDHYNSKLKSSPLSDMLFFISYWSLKFHTEILSSVHLLAARNPKEKLCIFLRWRVLGVGVGELPSYSVHGMGSFQQSVSSPAHDHIMSGCSFNNKYFVNKSVISQAGMHSWYFNKLCLSLILFISGQPDIVYFLRHLSIKSLSVEIRMIYL